MLIGFFNSGAAAAAPLTVVLVHGAFDYLAGSFVTTYWRRGRRPCSR